MLLKRLQIGALYKTLFPLPQETYTGMAANLKKAFTFQISECDVFFGAFVWVGGGGQHGGGGGSGGGGTRENLGGLESENSQM